mgnify:CR=1 FL=1
MPDLILTIRETPCWPLVSVRRLATTNFNRVPRVGSVSSLNVREALPKKKIGKIFTKQGKLSHLVLYCSYATYFQNWPLGFM